MGFLRKGPKRIGLIFRRADRTVAFVMGICFRSGFRIRKGRVRSRCAPFARIVGFRFFRGIETGLLRRVKRSGARPGERTVRSVPERLFFGWRRRIRQGRTRFLKEFRHRSGTSARSESRHRRNPHGNSGIRSRKLGEPQKLGNEPFARGRSDIENERPEHAREFYLRGRRYDCRRLVDRVFRDGIRKCETGVARRKRPRMPARLNRRNALRFSGVSGKNVFVTGKSLKKPPGIPEVFS